MTFEEDFVVLFEPWKRRIEALIREHPLQIISWEATRRCNLRCLHCGSPSEEVDLGKELTAAETIDAFNQIARDFDMRQFKHVNITGGEPFVRNDLLDVLSAISRWPFYRNIDIQTNGVFIANNPSILKEMKPWGVTGLGFSLDGFEQSHDALRGKEGTWVKASHAARLAVEAGYVVTVSFVAHSRNVHELPSFFDFVKKEVHPRVFRIMFIDPLGRALDQAEYLLSPGQVNDVIGFLRREYETSCSTYYRPSATMVELGCGGWLGIELEGQIRPFIFHCIAGLNNLGILHDGSLGSCSNISRQFIEGNLRTDQIKTVWEKRYLRYRTSDWKRVGLCLHCSEWDYCHGGPMHKRSKDNFDFSCLYNGMKKS